MKLKIFKDKINDNVPLGIALIAIFVLLAYSGAIAGDFLWDDDDIVARNLKLRSLEGLKDIWFTPGATIQYYPLVFTTLWIQYQLWGDHVVGYHLVNIILHIINAGLLWLLLRRLKVPWSYLIAAVFALHPVHVESVAWMSELKNLLSAFFYLFSLLVYLHFSSIIEEKTLKKKGHWWSYGLSFFLFMCALLSKTVTCSLPLVILLITWWKKQKVKWRDILLLLPFVAMGIVMGLLTISVEKQYAGASGSEFSFLFVDRCLIAGQALWFYPSKILWPQHLSFIYSRWSISATEPGQYAYLLMTFVVLYIFFVWRNKVGKGVITAILIYIITIFPALGFFDVETMKYTFVADHYQYLASIGILVLFIASLKIVFDKLKVTKRFIRYPLGVFLLVVLFIMSWHQAKIYKNKETLYRDVITKNPTSWLAYNNRGSYYLERGQYDLALADYNKALELKPNYPKVYSSRGLIFVENNLLDLALADFNKAIELDSHLFVAYNNRGILYQSLGQHALAYADFSKAIALHPGYVMAYNNRAANHILKKEYDSAEADLRRALSVNPYNSRAYYYLAIIYHAQGQWHKARDNALKAKHLGFVKRPSHIEWKRVNHQK